MIAIYIAFVKCKQVVTQSNKYLLKNNKAKVSIDNNNIGRYSQYLEPNNNTRIIEK